ncbi:MAG: hypothetical protein ABIH26_03475 [Candidatus Eisenbacteria bacterium]
MGLKWPRNEAPSLPVRQASPLESRKSLLGKSRLDWGGVRGRLLSSFYVPGAGDPGYEPMLADLARIFREHASNGRVTFEYET